MMCKPSNKVASSCKNCWNSGARKIALNTAYLHNLYGIWTIGLMNSSAVPWPLFPLLISTQQEKKRYQYLFRGWLRTIRRILPRSLWISKNWFSGHRWFRISNGCTVAIDISSILTSCFSVLLVHFSWGSIKIFWNPLFAGVTKFSFSRNNTRSSRNGSFFTLFTLHGDGNGFLEIVSIVPYGASWKRLGNRTDGSNWSDLDIYWNKS